VPRTVADLERHAARVGATLIDASVDGMGRLVGVFEVPDIDEGQPMATAILLEGLTTEDDAAGAVSPDLVCWAQRNGPAALHAWVKSQVRFEPEDVETFQSPQVTLEDGFGDCDDSERVLVAVARAAGMGARLVYFLQDGQPAHVTAQLRCKGFWCWAETTIDALFGEHPFEAMARLGLDRVDLQGTPYILVNGVAVPLRGSPGGMTGLVARGSRRGMGQASTPTWPSYLGDTFAQSLVTWSQSIGADPLDVLKLLLSESSLQPGAWNPNGFPSGQGAVGINQLSPGNWSYFQNQGLSVAQYKALTAEQQLPYAFAYWKAVMASHGLATISGRDLYWLNFLPAYYVPNATDAHVIVTSSSGYYTNNTGLDHGHKGFITAGDLQLSLDAQEGIHSTLWPLVSNAIIQDEGGGPTLPSAVTIIAGAVILGIALADPSLITGLLDDARSLVRG
jgi:hypothetical protein